MFRCTATFRIFKEMLKRATCFLYAGWTKQLLSRVAFEPITACRLENRFLQKSEGHFRIGAPHGPALSKKVEISWEQKGEHGVPRRFYSSTQFEVFVKSTVSSHGPVQLLLQSPLLPLNLWGKPPAGKRLSATCFLYAGWTKQLLSGVTFEPMTARRLESRCLQKLKSYFSIWQNTKLRICSIFRTELWGSLWLLRVPVTYVQ